jgi:hypothetical protein
VCVCVKSTGERGGETRLCARIYVCAWTESLYI